MKGAKPDAWMPLYIGDYLADTARLTTEQHGAYLLLIMDYWRNGPPVDDNDELAEITRLDTAKWLRMRPKIARFFTVADGRWTQKRIDEELAGAQARSDKAALKAQAAANARWNKEPQKTEEIQRPDDAPSNATSMLEECPSPSPSPPSVREDATASLSPPDDVPSPSKYPEPFEAAWKAYPHVKGRSSKPKALGLWRRLPTSTRDALPAAVARYAREGREPKMDCGAPAMDRWLRDAKFEDWLGGGSPTPPPTTPTDPWPRRLRSWADNRYWNTTDWGPKPGAPGCLVPPALLPPTPEAGAAVLPFPPTPDRSAA